jgi:hypothetical protein
VGYVETNPLLSIRGRIKGLYIAKYGDKYILKTVPEREARPPTPAQLPVRAGLAAANLYWTYVKTQPDLEAVYVQAATVKRKRAIDLDKADFLHWPVITDIDSSAYLGQPGGTIRVKAQDDLKVIAVTVRILDLTGTVIEQGAAAWELSSCGWVYTTTVAVDPGKAVVIEATATDRPQHSAVKKVDHVCGPRT